MSKITYSSGEEGSLRQRGRPRALVSPLGAAALLSAALILSGCSRFGNSLNPFQEEPPPRAYLGKLDDSALRDGGTSIEDARESLEEVARYPKAHQPQPQNPVIQPSVVRLMWVPDHLNKNGDLVPAHYYYLKVLDDRWAATDVFDQEALINGQSESTTSVPFTQGR
ncbi:hypothetical protein MRY87_10725 [bacterium]|nr:hypothetical protein [bacterium]